jgi:hypothetical protein
MADQKKKSGAGGEGGQEPPEELAEAKPASAPSGDPTLDNLRGNGKVSVEGTVNVTGRVGIDGPVTINPPAAPIPVMPAGPVRIEHTGTAKVSLQRSTANVTDDQALWVAIRDRTSVIGFQWYESFIDHVLCKGEEVPENIQDRRRNSQISYGVDAYQLLKTATETFLILKCGVLRKAEELLPTPKRFDNIRSQEEARLGRSNLTLGDLQSDLRRYIGTGNLPYIDRVLDTLNEMPAVAGAPDKESPSPFCDTLLDAGPFYPLMLELIWSYWHEEGMLVQAINAISLRFQNKRVQGDNNGLANLELSPLRPLSNLLWGYIQDEPFRLTVARRAYEYSHQYGITLMGKAVPGIQPADHRSKFLEAFHSLLRQVAQFYKEDADTTVIANGFPLLNSLKEVHMLLAEGAHNQFGDLPWTARVEMLIQQWLLSRRELRDFLRGRPMVPYKEPWMGQVDTLRRMLGWGDTPVTHFRDLGTFGEQILLSIRYGDWIAVDDEDAAKNWARYWKPEIQGYVHAYRAATGMDLTSADQQRLNAVSSMSPSVLLQRRLARQGAR